LVRISPKVCFLFFFCVYPALVSLIRGGVGGMTHMLLMGKPPFLKFCHTPPHPPHRSHRGASVVVGPVSYSVVVLVQGYPTYDLRVLVRVVLVISNGVGARFLIVGSFLMYFFCIFFFFSSGVLIVAFGFLAPPPIEFFFFCFFPPPPPGCCWTRGSVCLGCGTLDNCKNKPPLFIFFL